MKNTMRSLGMILLLAVCVGCSSKDSSKDNRLQGEWRSAMGTTFTFDNNQYGYYKDGDDKKDNYYKGSYTFKKGEEAMAADQLGISETEFAKLQKSQGIEKEDIYAVKMDMETLVSGGTDKSDQLAEDNYYFFAFYFTGKDTIHAVNVSTFDEISLTRHT